MNKSINADIKEEIIHSRGTKKEISDKKEKLKDNMESVL